MTPLRLEIHRIVTEAKRAGKPITVQIIWGMLSRDISQTDLNSFLGMMISTRQLVLVKPPKGYFPARRGQPPMSYEPGPEKPTGRKVAEKEPGLMGFREYGRLEAAREAAKAWAMNGKAAA